MLSRGACSGTVTVVGLTGVRAAPASVAVDPVCLDKVANVLAAQSVDIAPV